MKSGKNNKTLKLISATAVTLFSLTTVFVATIAWFALNENVDGSGMNINVTRVDGKLQYVHFHSFNSASSNSLSFNKDPFVSYEYDWDSKSLVPVGEQSDTWGMGTYTSLEKEHSMLVIFEFDRDYASNSVGDSYIKGRTTVDDFIGRRQTTDDGEGANVGAPYYTLPMTQVNDENHPTSLLMEKKNNTDYYALSSVAAFRNRTFSNSQYENFLTNNTGATLTFPTNTLEEDETFTDIDNNAETYEFNSTPLLYESNGSGDVKYVALIIEYSQDAIGYIYSTYLGDAGFNQYDAGVHFTCDWIFEVC